MRGSQGSFQGKEGVFSKPCRQPGVILVRLETGRVKREGVQLTFSHGSCKRNVSERREPSEGLPDDSVVKNLPANAGDVCSIPGSGRSPGGRQGNPRQYSCLGNPGQGSLAGYSPWGCKETDTT